MKTRSTSGKSIEIIQYKINTPGGGEEVKEVKSLAAQSVQTNMRRTELDQKHLLLF